MSFDTNIHNLILKKNEKKMTKQREQTGKNHDSHHKVLNR